MVQYEDICSQADNSTISAAFTARKELYPQALRNESILDVEFSTPQFSATKIIFPTTAKEIPSY